MNNSIFEALNSTYTKSEEKSFLDNGNKLFKEEKYYDAIDQYNIAIKLNPSNPCPHYNKAISLIKIGNHDDATKSFDILMEINPDYFAELNRKF